MRFAWFIPVLLTVSGCSILTVQEPKPEISVLDSSQMQTSNVYEQYVTIASYFELQADVPFIARSRVQAGLPQDFKQTFASLSDLTEANALSYFYRHPDHVVGMQTYLNDIIRSGYIPHEQGKKLLLAALKGSLNGYAQTVLPAAN